MEKLITKTVDVKACLQNPKNFREAFSRAFIETGRPGRCAANFVSHYYLYYLANPLSDIGPLGDCLLTTLKRLQHSPKKFDAITNALIPLIQENITAEGLEVVIRRALTLPESDLYKAINM